ncbi:GIY-YIG nuclease family protein, partial [Candidatus Dojkabacteria bacterium]|nr:GIY-YIG nuclease family protein [Candidatus Dojkabacteria bacterium]
WLNDICSHMINIGNRFKRCVYIYEFSDNYVYIGLTFNIHKRNIQHLNSGPVYKHLQINNNYKLKMLTDYINVDDAKKKEIFFINEYRNNNYNLLNTHNGGEIGGSTPKWIFSVCLEEAKKCKKLSEYRKYKSYNAAWRNNWITKICEICEFDISQIIKINKA